MCDAKHNTDTSASMNLPLAELANPENLAPLSAFVDNLVSPTIIEALMVLASLSYLSI